MAYRTGEREQMTMLPNSIEEYVGKDDPVRAYDAFVDALNFKELGIILDGTKVGNSEYNPIAMVKLLVYGYAYGHRSSRKLERAVHHNLSFIWLMGGLQPDHKTIANFRKNNKTALKNILKQCVRFCIKLDLIEGNTLFVDGTKIRANASLKNKWTRERCEEYLRTIDQHIASVLAECDSVDTQEEDQASLVQLQEDLKNKQALKDKVQAILKELKEQNKDSTNTTDPDCRAMRSVQGAHASYNAQLVVDEKNGLIVNSDVVNDTSDVNQFAQQIDQANATLNKPCETACADAGYADTEELSKIDAQGIAVIVPSQKQALHKDIRAFHKDQFSYDKDNDCYRCPEGHLLTHLFDNPDRRQVYQIKRSALCKACRHWGVCTMAKNGRRIVRLAHETLKQKMEQYYMLPASQAVYKLRKQKVELPFGHVKRNLGVTAFLLRGLDGVQAEMAILSCCFNIARMITLRGIRGFIPALSS